jgi:hypothetical protein
MRTYLSFLAFSVTAVALSFLLYGCIEVAPPTVTLIASTSSVTAGQSLTLTWTSTNATGVQSTNIPGAVATAGSVEVTPLDNPTYYTIVVYGSGGDSAQASVTIVVNPLDYSFDSSLTSADNMLTDDTYYEDWEWTAPRTGQVEISLHSSVFDPYLYAFSGTSGNHNLVLIDQDDDSGPGTDALIVFNATGGTRYTFRFNTLFAYETGSFTARIREIGRARSDEPAWQPTFKNGGPKLLP